MVKYRLTVDMPSHNESDLVLAQKRLNSAHGGLRMSFFMVFFVRMIPLAMKHRDSPGRQVMVHRFEIMSQIAQRTHNSRQERSVCGSRICIGERAGGKGNTASCCSCKQPQP